MKYVLEDIHIDIELHEDESKPTHVLMRMDKSFLCQLETLTAIEGLKSADFWSDEFFFVLLEENSDGTYTKTGADDYCWLEDLYIRASSVDNFSFILEGGLEGEDFFADLSSATRFELSKDVEESLSDLSINLNVD